MLTARSSTVQVRQGALFEVFLQLSPSEKIKNLKIDIEPPHDFKVVKYAHPPADFSAGDTYIAAYVISPPVAEFNGTSKSENRILTFNVSYENESGNQQITYRSASLDLDFTQSRSFYNMYACIGLLIGGTVKALAKYRELALAAEKAGKTLALNGLKLPLVLPVITTLVVGGIVMMVLSREKLPTKSYYDTITLGAAVALIADDQLLLRISSIVPK